MNITGLTGQSGSGKTTVAKLMQSFGFYHIDCDRLVHEKVYTNKAVLIKIQNAFGKDFVINGTVNRKKLGAHIFSNKTEYNKLMMLIKQDIIDTVENEIQNNADKHILLDAPTLFEFGMENRCDHIIGVISENVLSRICKRDGITESEAKLRLQNQKSADFFKERCDFIISNDADLSELETQVSNISELIMKGY